MVVITTNYQNEHQNKNQNAEDDDKIRPCLTAGFFLC